jgi:CheY-like chemotaxis protein
MPVRDRDGKVIGIVVLALDITERKQLEEQFWRAQKMEAIGTLAGGIAHDFNNILAAIIGYTELARRRAGAGDPVTREFLDAVLQGGTRATALVRQILTFSRRQESHRRPVRLHEVVAEPLKLLRATIPANIEFDLALAPDLPVVLADPTQIHQIVMNLGTNAAHAMRDRPGRFGVRLEGFTVDALLAGTIAGLQTGPYVRLSVSDTGHGIDPATLGRIFEPFFTTKGPGEGTGLGLSVVHGIMQSHDGVVSVYSQPEEGTVFHLFFPAIMAEAAAGPSHGLAAIPAGHGQRILFVDDEKPLALLGQKMLQELGYAVVGQTSVAEALALMRATPGAFDLVITDLTMPGMLGTDFARQLLLLRPGLPIILATGYAATLTLEQVRELGIREMLLKPLTLRSLGAAIGRALARPAAVAATGRILLIDDDALYRKMVRINLVAAGHAVTEARNGREGLAQYSLAPADLVITDIIMPDQDGIKTIVALKKRWPGAIIIAMSGGGHVSAAEYLHIAGEMGAARVLKKPFTNEALLAAVNELLPGGRSAAPTPPAPPSHR